MYAVATLRLARLTNALALASWSRAMAWIALAAWAATACGLIVASLRIARAQRVIP
jgi:hypothetical protein